MGGQTALNAALSLERAGVLKKFGVEMIGARAEVIDKAEDRELFREAMNKIGLETPRSRLADAASLKRADRQKYKDEIARIEAAYDRRRRAGVARSFCSRRTGRGHEAERRRRYSEKGLIEALEALPDIGLPAIIRPSFTLGGTGGGIAYNREEFLEIVERGLDASPTSEVLIEESVLGWKEYEMEVVRDKDDNCIIVCSIENIDPMGVHTGDFDHGGAGADADRQGISDHAQRLDQGAARDRGGDRRVERAVRGEPGRRAAGDHRDEPARVALLRARLEGDRLSRSPRSPPSSPSATRWTSSPTTSPAAPRRRASSRPSTMW